MTFVPLDPRADRRPGPPRRAGLEDGIGRHVTKAGAERRAGKGEKGRYIGLQGLERLPVARTVAEVRISVKGTMWTKTVSVSGVGYNTEVIGNMHLHNVGLMLVN